jgi:hypothetical protein
LFYLTGMKKIFLFLCILSIGIAAIAQTTVPPFRKEIDAFKKKDSAQMPAKQSILFVGSSSFTKWTDVQDYFPGYPILNRGFGGSSLPDVIRYVDEVIIPYDPKQIVIYCGENDVAGSDTITRTNSFAKVPGIIFYDQEQIAKSSYCVHFIKAKCEPLEI